MNKWIKGALALVFTVFLFAGLINYFSVDVDSAGNNPAIFGNYRNSGYYKINSESILLSLDSGDKNVFLPLKEDPDRIDTNYESASLTQVDYLRITSALRQHVWGEPLESKTWDVHDVTFEKGCKDNPNGFNVFEITYYKTLKVGWEITYSTRFIRVELWRGLIMWGGDETFTTPFLRGWHGIDLTKFNITADAALQIAEKNGGEEARVKAEKCIIYVTSSQKDNNMWNIEYFLADFMSIINPYNGSYKTISNK